MDMVDIPSGYVKVAIENGPLEIVSCPINMVVFRSYVYQRVMAGNKSPHINPTPAQPKIFQKHLGLCMKNTEEGMTRQASQAPGLHRHPFQVSGRKWCV